MDTKLILAVVSATMMLSGCITTPKLPQKNIYGWQNLSPPRQNVLGKKVRVSQSGLDVIGEPVYNVSSETVELSGSILSVTNTQYSDAKASLDIIAKEVSAELGYNYSKNQQTQSTKLQISQLRSLKYNHQLDTKFVYQCLAASKYEFSAARKGGLDINVDATKIAERFGVDKASVILESNKADELKVIVEDSSICLSYLSAYFEENNVTILGDLKNKYKPITGPYGEKKSSYELKPNEVSNFVSPGYIIGSEPANNPSYRLQATIDNKDRVQLKVCTNNKGMKGNGEIGYSCEITLEEDEGNGDWSREYIIDTFEYGKQKYKVAIMDIDAKRGPNNTIQINSAKLFYPQYKLVVN